MPVLLVAALLAADASAPRTVVLVTRRTNVTPAEGQSVLSKVQSALVAAGLSVTLSPDEASVQLKKLGFPDSATCAGRRECVMELGTQLRVEWVFSVSLARIGKDQSVAVELMRTSDASILETEAIVLSPGKQVTPALVAEFSERAKARLRPTPSPTLVIPKDLTPEKPPPTPADPLPLPPPPPPPAPEPERSHVGSFITGGLGLAALVGAGLLLNAGLQQRAQLLGSASVREETGRVSSLTWQQASRLNDQANLGFIFSGILAAVGAALGVVAVAIW